MIYVSIIFQPYAINPLDASSHQPDTRYIQNPGRGGNANQNNRVSTNGYRMLATSFSQIILTKNIRPDDIGFELSFKIK